MLAQLFLQRVGSKCRDSGPAAGQDAERRSQVLALGRQDSPQAVHALIGALADPDNAIRWLASSSLYLLGTREVARSPTFDKSSVSSALEAYLAQCTDPTGRAAAEKLLGRLGQGQTRDV
jgi:HEAT repeat protein